MTSEASAAYAKYTQARRAREEQSHSAGRGPLKQQTCLFIGGDWDGDRIDVIAESCHHVLLPRKLSMAEFTAEKDPAKRVQNYRRVTISEAGGDPSYVYAFGIPDAQVLAVLIEGYRRD